MPHNFTRRISPAHRTTLSKNFGTKHSNMQPLLIKAAALTTTPHPHHSNNSKQHTYLNKAHRNGDNKSAFNNQMLSVIE